MFRTPAEHAARSLRAVRDFAADDVRLALGKDRMIDGMRTDRHQRILGKLGNSAQVMHSLS